MKKRCSSGALVGSTSTMRLCFANDNAFGATHLHKAPLLCPPRCFVRHGCRVPRQRLQCPTRPGPLRRPGAPERPQFRIPLRRGPLPGLPHGAAGDPGALRGLIRWVFLTWPGRVAYPPQGIQSKGVIANAKHYILNNQETNRNNVSELADRRTRWEVDVRVVLRALSSKPPRAGLLRALYRRRGGWGWKRHVQLQPNQRHLVV